MGSILTPTDPRWPWTVALSDPVWGHVCVTLKTFLTPNDPVFQYSQGQWGSSWGPVGVSPQSWPPVTLFQSGSSRGQTPTTRHGSLSFIDTYLEVFYWNYLEVIFYWRYWFMYALSSFYPIVVYVLFSLNRFYCAHSVCSYRIFLFFYFMHFSILYRGYYYSIYTLFFL